MADSAFFSVPAPLDATPTRGQMRAANFKGFGNFVRQNDCDPTRILQDFGLPTSACQAEELHVDMRAFVDVFEHCAEAFSDRLFGLRLGKHQAADVFGCVTTLCRSAPDFRSGIQSFIEFVPVIHSPDICLDLLEGNQVTEFHYGADTDFGACDQSKFQAAMLNLKLLREIGGEAFQPSYLSLDVDVSRRDIDEIEQFVGCRFHVSRVNAVRTMRALKRAVSIEDIELDGLEVSRIRKSETAPTVYSAYFALNPTSAPADRSTDFHSSSAPCVRVSAMRSPASTRRAMFSARSM